MIDKEADLVFDWAPSPAPRSRVELDDESLRDGLQSPSVRQPPVQERVRLLRQMADLGIDAADIGMPVSGEAGYQATLALARAAADERLPIALNCAGRTVVADLKPIADISAKAGVPIEAMAFIGSSPIRMIAEGWTLMGMVRAIRESVRFAVREGLKVCLVTEDTTRSRPDILRILYHAALEEGATRICLCDTAGYATPEGTARLVRFAREDLLAYDGCADVQVDWHGHNDRGLALANALAAIDAGADRVHGTALGVGERCGNSAMEQLLVNLHLAGDDRDLSALPDYCATASASFDRVIPPDHPVVGGDAFRTASGIHTAAIVKAGAGHGEWLADRVYSSVPASSFGRHQHIEVGPGSGASNVEYWLTRHGFTPEPGLVALILQVARNSEQMLRDDELFDLTIFGLQHSAAA